MVRLGLGVILLPRRLLLLRLGLLLLLPLLMSVGTAKLEQIEKVRGAIGSRSHVASGAVVDGRRWRRRQMVHGNQGSRCSALEMECEGRQDK